MLPLSARSPQALVVLAQRYEAWLDAHPEADITDVCFTAGVGRSHFDHRAGLVVDSVHGCPRTTGRVGRGPAGTAAQYVACVVTRRRRRGSSPGRAASTRGWRASCSSRARVHRYRDTMRGRGRRHVAASRYWRYCSIPTAMTKKPCGTPAFTQPALFAVEMGLARLWQSWGIEPDVVLGHSVGQYAAACVAGVFSLEDGARLLAERGRLFGSLPEGGRMVAVFADAEHVEDLAEEFPRVSVAAYNGPNTVLSGPGADLEQIVATCGDDGIRCSWLDTSHAFHSELLEPVLGEFESYAARVEFAVPTLPLVCNRTGAVLTAATPLNAEYWRRHSRQPVQFAESVRTVAQLGCSVLMEIGPQPILTAAALQVWPEHSVAPRAIASLRKGVDARRQIAEALAAAYVAGHRPDFGALRHRGNHLGRRRLELPTYPFQRRPLLAQDRRGPSPTGPSHPESWVVQRISPRATPSTPAGCPSNLSRGWQTTSSMAPSSFRARPTRRWPLRRPGRRRVCKMSSFLSRSFWATRTPERCSSPCVRLTATVPARSRCTAARYGDRDAEWSLNAEGSLSALSADVFGGDDEPGSEPMDSIDAATERLSRARPQQLVDTFADNELALGPTWSTSLKSLWIGDE